MQKIPNSKLILDTAHALQYNSLSSNKNCDHIEDMIKIFSPRIQHVHLSDYRFNEKSNRFKDHQLIQDCDINKFSM